MQFNIKPNSPRSATSPAQRYVTEHIRAAEALGNRDRSEKLRREKLRLENRARF